MLEVRELRAGYGATEVLRGLDLDVGAGEVVAVLGANGVGKTTLNKVLSGVVRASAGTIRFDGQDITGADPRTIVAAGLIHVPEGRRVFPDVSVRDNLVLGSYRRGRARRGRNLAHVLDVFPRLQERLGQSAGTLSGGEQQMLAIGRGMMAEPALLILDEPSLGLSPLLVEQMFALICRLHADGMPVLLVEQNVVQSLEIASRAYIVENGACALSGSADSLRNDAALRRAYLGL